MDSDLGAQRVREPLSRACDIWCRIQLCDMAINISWGSNSFSKTSLLWRYHNKEAILIFSCVWGCASWHRGPLRQGLISLGLIEKHQKKRTSKKTVAARVWTVKLFQVLGFETHCLNKVIHHWTYLQSFTLIIRPLICRYVAAVISDLIHP